MPTLDTVRTELRNAIFWTGFLAMGQDIEANGDAADQLRQESARLAEFGVRSELLAADEGNDWLAGIWGRQPLGKVSLKYTGKEAPCVTESTTPASPETSSPPSSDTPPAT